MTQDPRVAGSDARPIDLTTASARDLIEWLAADADPTPIHPEETLTAAHRRAGRYDLVLELVEALATTLGEK